MIRTGHQDIYLPDRFCLESENHCQKRIPINRMRRGLPWKYSSRFCEALYANNSKPIDPRNVDFVIRGSHGLFWLRDPCPGCFLCSFATQRPTSSFIFLLKSVVLLDDGSKRISAHRPLSIGLHASPHCHDIIFWTL